MLNFTDHEKILKALRFADRHHAGQVRKGSGLDYFVHPLVCTYLLAQVKRSHNIVDLICAVLLHDTVEDTLATYAEILSEFGPLVMSIVQELENDETEIALIGKLAYHKKKVLGISNYGLLGKLADRLHNILDRPTAKYVADTVELIRHLQQHRPLTQPQQELAEAILDACEARQAEERKAVAGG